MTGGAPINDVAVVDLSCDRQAVDHERSRDCEEYTCVKNDTASLRAEGGSTEVDE